MHRLWTTLGIAGGLLLLTGVSACADDPGVKADINDDEADDNGIPVNDERLYPVVYLNYDGQPNVVAWCDGANRIYTTSREADTFEVVANDPICQGAGDPNQPPLGGTD